MLLFLTSLTLFLQIAHSAVAHFSVNNSGVQGTVTINDRKITVDLDISKINYANLTGGENCFVNGSRYHIHTYWNYPDNKDRVGPTACGASYTGNHWDPWVACSSSTNNTNCLTYTSSNHRCVPSSSAYTNTTKYTCNTTVYGQNPFACEVSDFDGKYGRLYLSDNNTFFRRTDSSFWEVKSSDVQFKSIVFHCGTSNARAFCAPFDTSGDTSNLTVTQSGNSMKATFSGLHDSYVQLNNNGDYEYKIDLGSIAQNLTCPNITYRIYDAWHANETSYVGNAACSGATVGRVYDPTVSCLENSDSPFCNGTEICNNTAYYYNCTADNDRYYCSPSDLSGKYGKLVTNDFTKVVFELKGNDQLMIPMTLLQNKSLVIECSDYTKTIACAKFEEVSGGGGGSSSSNGLSTTDIILIVFFTVFGACILVVIFYFLYTRYRMKGSSEENRTLLAKQ